MTDTATTERLTFYSEVPIGTRVRLIDAGGDSSSSARVGDMGTVARDGHGVLTVTMDDGHETTRNTPRWEIVKEENTPELTEAQQREVWAALPIREAYPIGSQWHHRSYGTNVYTVIGYRGASELHMHDEQDGRDNYWVRGALDTFGTPVGLIPSAPVVESTEDTQEPYRPAAGDRVRVVSDLDEPANNGMTATVLEAGEPGATHTHVHKVRYDEGQRDHRSHAHYGWWVKEIEPLMPATPEEFRAAIAAAVEKAREEALVQGKREGRQAAHEEAERRLNSIVESAHEYANDNNLCSQFDRFMVENGLEPRDSYTQDFRVTVTYSVYVSARPDDEDAIQEAAMEQINNGYESPEFDWDEV